MNTTTTQTTATELSMSSGLSFCAQPYSLDAHGFYFSDYEEYTTKAEALRDTYGNPVEEFEIQICDGDAEDVDLFNACGVNQANLEQFFDDVLTLDDHQKPAFFYLMNVLNCTIEQALDKIDEPSIYEGELKEAAEELFDECYLSDIPESVRNYIDYAAFARDCELGGDMTEFEFAGTTYTVTNAACC
jgi:hypothetical protein